MRSSGYLIGWTRPEVHCTGAKCAAQRAALGASCALDKWLIWSPHSYEPHGMSRHASPRSWQGQTLAPLPGQPALAAAMMPPPPATAASCPTWSLLWTWAAISLLHSSFNTLVHRNGREWSWPKAGRRAGSGFHDWPLPAPRGAPNVLKSGLCALRSSQSAADCDPSTLGASQGRILTQQAPGKCGCACAARGTVSLVLCG